MELQQQNPVENALEGLQAGGQVMMSIPAEEERGTDYSGIGGDFDSESLSTSKSTSTVSLFGGRGVRLTAEQRVDVLPSPHYGTRLGVASTGVPRKRERTEPLHYFLATETRDVGHQPQRFQLIDQQTIDPHSAATGVFRKLPNTEVHRTTGFGRVGAMLESHQRTGG